MDELEGLNFIDNNGNYLGVIERAFYNNNCFIIHYRDGNKYNVYQMNFIDVPFFRTYAKIKSDRYNIIRDKEIGFIYHFSPTTNLTNILDYGICSREQANRFNIPIQTTDPLRLDGELNKISASISFPNYKMRYKLEQQGINLIIFDISPKILLAKLDTQFYHTNAANAIFNTIDKRTLTTNEAFLNMYNQHNRDENLHPRFTTDPQAEILVDSIINRSYIKRVIVPYQNNQVEEMCYEKEYQYAIIPELYKPRCDYGRW